MKGKALSKDIKIKELIVALVQILGVVSDPGCSFQNYTL
jgi:hypothetical protein